MTPERREAIVRLLQTRDEHLPEPGHRTDTSPGFIHDDPDHVDTCPDCLANDKTMFGCETCHGSGRVRAPRKRDPYATDAVAPYGLDGARHERTKARDREIEILGQQLRPASTVDEAEDAKLHPYAWERARKRMYELYSYGELDRALEQLRLRDDLAYRMLHQVHIYAWLKHITPAVEAICERGIAFLDEHLPNVLRAPGADGQPRVVGRVERGAGDRPRSWRDAEICRAVLEAHVATTDVARTWGISVSQVNKIVRAAA